MHPLALNTISQAKHYAMTGMTAVVEAFAALPQFVQLLTERLLHPRTFHPNALFRNGEIEDWGRGFSQMLDLREEVASPRPQPPHDPGNLWGRISFTPMPIDLRSQAGLGNSSERP